MVLQVAAAQRLPCNSVPGSGYVCSVGASERCPFRVEPSARPTLIVTGPDFVTRLTAAVLLAAGCQSFHGIVRLSRAQCGLLPPRVHQQRESSLTPLILASIRRTPDWYAGFICIIALLVCSTCWRPSAAPVGTSFHSTLMFIQVVEAAVCTCLISRPHYCCSLLPCRWCAGFALCAARRNLILAKLAALCVAGLAVITLTPAAERAVLPEL